jgi:hypothetical protein
LFIGKYCEKERKAASTSLTIQFSSTVVHTKADRAWPHSTPFRP